MKADLLEIAYAVTPCPPGQHPISWGRYGGHVCAPDVPGAGLPWDLPTAVCAAGVVIFWVFAIVWLIALEIDDRRSRK